MEVAEGDKAAGEPPGASEAEAAQSAQSERGDAVRTEFFCRKVSWSLEFLHDVGGASVARALVFKAPLDTSQLKGAAPDEELDGPSTHTLNNSSR